jgi:hypothetical protein
LTIDPADVGLDVVGADVVNNATVQRQNTARVDRFYSRHRRRWLAILATSSAKESLLHVNQIDQQKPQNAGDPTGSLQKGRLEDTLAMGTPRFPFIRADRGCIAWMATIRTMDWQAVPQSYNRANHRP